MSTPMIVAAWLLFSLSAWAAVIEFARMPNYSRNEDGLDVSLGECIALGMVSLLPPLALAFNCMWISVVWGRWLQGRPLRRRIVFKRRSIETMKRSGE